MPKDRETVRKARETRGGYPAGGKQISEFTPPPGGPAPGGKRGDEPSSSRERADRPQRRDVDRETG
jgi:hypothetical protein